MTIDEFKAALDAYGPDMELWPVALSAGAFPLLDNSSEARQCLTATKAIDRALERHLTTPMRAPSYLADRIVAEAKETNDIPPPFAEIVKRLAKQHPKVGWRRLIYLDRSTSVILTIAALAVCFVSGVLASQVPFTADTQNASLFVSILYADLTW